MDWPEQPAWTDAKRAAFYPTWIIEFLGKFPVATPDIAAWAAPMIIGYAHLPLKSVAVRLRTAGRALTPAEKRARGLPVRLKIGEDFANALTQAGCDDPSTVAEAIAAYPIRAESRARMAWLIRDERHPARMIVYGDEGTCAAAHPLFKQILPWRNLPSFPLPACDKLLCRCSFDRAMPAKPAKWPRRHRKPNGCAVAALAILATGSMIAGAIAMVM